MARTIAHELIECGIKINASPVVDLRFPKAHEVIGSRALASDPTSVASLGRVAIDNYLASGILPVLKHIPGHGRSVVDSHYNLPRIDASIDQLLASDCQPFIQLQDAPLAIPSHIVYSSIDALFPMTFSSTGLHWLRHTLGFQGLLISDCLHMNALDGTIAERAVRAQQAGMDIMVASHTELAEKEQVFQAVSQANKTTMQRVESAWQSCGDFRSLATKDDWQLIEHWNEQRGGEDPTAALSDS